MDGASQTKAAGIARTTLSQRLVRAGPLRCADQSPTSHGRRPHSHPTPHGHFSSLCLPNPTEDRTDSPSVWTPSSISRDASHETRPRLAGGLSLRRVNTFSILNNKTNIFSITLILKGNRHNLLYQYLNEKKTPF